MADLKLDDLRRPDRRAAELTRLRNLKMAKSAHRYVRGSTKQFYAWLENDTTGRIPAGPPVWICGDCHIGNIGPIGSVDGEVDIAIRDLDQTVIGNPAHDLIRLGLSLAMSIRSSDLPGVTTALMIAKMVEGYRHALAHPRSAGRDMRPEAVRTALRQALRRRWKQLAHERIENTDPSIPLGSRFWPVSKEEALAIDRLFERPEVVGLLTALGSRPDDAKIEVVDRAYWMKGCSSLGLLRFAVLVRVGGKKRRGGQLCLVDVKQAVAPLAPRAAGDAMPAHQGQRVLTGARALSPHLGERTVASTLLDRSVFLRELFPQDLKLDLDILPLEQVEHVARYLAWVVGRAHARQLDKKGRLDWLAKIDSRHRRDLAVPSWLWSTIVDLVGLHESGYLEHCREYCADQLRR